MPPPAATPPREDPAAFVRHFYKVLLCFAPPGLTIAWLFGATRGFVGYLLGYVFVFLIFILWDWSLKHMIQPKQGDAVLQTMLVFLRYGLLGLLFYGIIRVQHTFDWVWFAGGFATKLPALLLSAVLFGKKSNQE